jgi:glycosyltransferase involved in cell wall biosynthesis
MDPKKRSVERVAMLAHTCYLRDPRVRREAEALAEKGIDVHVIALSEDGRAPGAREPRHSVLNGVQIHRLPVRRRRGGPLRYLYEYFMVALLGGLKLALLHARRRLDAVHVHNMPDVLVFAAIVPRLTGSTVILDIHDPMAELFLSWNRNGGSKLVARLLRLQEKISCAFADRVLSVNETMRENLRGKGVADDKMFIVHNFPDQKLFPLREAPLSWPRNRESLVMLYSGTVTEHYDLGLAVKAIARLAGEIPMKLRIVGEGNRLREVLDLASKLGVRDSVTPVGLVPLERVRDEMRQADLGISCHRAGIFGDLYFSTKIVEYLTQGLPVISPRTYTVAKYLPADCMFYFEPGNDEALAETLRFMWLNPAEVLRRLNTARQSVPRLSWQAEKMEFQAFYSDMLSARNPTARVVVGK